MIAREKLEQYAEKLMFKMNDEEYKTLQQEFDIFLKQMELIGKIDNIESVEPMTFPFVLYQTSLREDIEKEALSTGEVLKNAKETSNNQVKVPKVVE